MWLMWIGKSELRGLFSITKHLCGQTSQAENYAKVSGQLSNEIAAS
jgi:hypothetical protein